MFETYKKKINQIEKFYNQGDTENTILGCGKLIEHIVSVLFSEFHLYLKNPEERKLFLEQEKKWGKDYIDFIKRPTTGRSLRYYNQLLNIFPDHKRISTSVKDDFNLVNSLRNSAAHAGSNPSDNDAYKALRATKSILKKIDMFDETEDTIGLPLHIYLVYSSIKEKFRDAKSESDFSKIISDSEILLPDLMNITIDKLYTSLTIDQKETLISLFLENGKCNLNFESCHSFFMESGLFSLYGKKSSDLRYGLEDIIESKDNDDQNTRMGARPYLNAMDTMVEDLKEKNTDNFFNLADRIKVLYLNDNQIDDKEHNALIENAKMVKFDLDSLEVLIANVVKEIENHLIKYRTLFITEKADENTDEVKENLINMIKLGTPLNAIESLAKQQGYVGSIKKLFNENSNKTVKVKSSEDSSINKESYGTRFSSEKGEYSEIELNDLLSNYFSDKNSKDEKQKRKKYKLRTFFGILLSEERVFNREEIKNILTQEKTWITHFEEDWSGRDFRGSNGQLKTYPWYVGNLMSNISKDFTRSNNDFLRQVLSFESEARISSGFEIKAGAAGSYKNSYSVEKKYRVMLKKILSAESINDEDIKKTSDKGDVTKENSNSKPQDSVKSSEDPIEDFRLFLAKKYPTLKLPNGKKYVEFPIGKGMLVCCMVKSNGVNVFLYSGLKVPAREVFDKLNSLGVTGKTINDKYTINPMPGSRNPNVVRIDILVPYNGKDLNNNEFRHEVNDVYSQLLELCKPIAV